MGDVRRACRVVGVYHERLDVQRYSLGVKPMNFLHVIPEPPEPLPKPGTDGALVSRAMFPYDTARQSEFYEIRLRTLGEEVS